MSNIVPTIETHVMTREERDLLIKKHCAPDLSHDEFAIFMGLCSRYALDPMAKEMMASKFGGRTSYIITHAGYLAIANRDPNFDGMDADVVYEGDTLTKRENGSMLIVYGEAHMNFDRTKLKGAYANVYRKDRSICSSAFVSIKDYGKQSSNTWTTYPNAMILKTAETAAIKRAFSINDDSEQEE